MSKLIYPNICIVCECFFNTQIVFKTDEELNFENIFGDLICHRCIKKYQKLGCSVFEAGWGRKLNIGYINTLSSVFVFRESVVDIIHLFKYNNRLDLGIRMAYFILELYLKYHAENKPDFIIPIPIHRFKQRKRGYNQTYILSKQTKLIAKNQGIDFPDVKKNILFKQINTKSQTQLNSDLRKKNLEKAFVIKYPYRIQGRRALLIDDVVTTGTTLNECAKVLLDNGALSVDAITFARAL